MAAKKVVTVKTVRAKAVAAAAEDATAEDAAPMEAAPAPMPVKGPSFVWPCIVAVVAVLLFGALVFLQWQEMSHYNAPPTLFPKVSLRTMPSPPPAPKPTREPEPAEEPAEEVAAQASAEEPAEAPTDDGDGDVEAATSEEPAE